MSEYAIEKVSEQPLVQDATFIDPSSDADAPQGILLAVYCTTTPTDGDVAVYVAANSRFELSGAPTSSPVTVSDGAGGFDLVYTSGGEVVYA